MNSRKVRESMEIKTTAGLVIFGALISGCASPDDDVTDWRFAICEPTVGADRVEPKDYRIIDAPYTSTSRGISTEDLDVQFSVTGNENGEAVAYAHFHDMPEFDFDCLFAERVLAGECDVDMDSKRLVDGDTLTVSAGGEIYTMVEASGGYRALVPYNHEGLRFSFSLHRTYEEDATGSYVIMPAPVDFILPDKSVYENNEEIPITWTPSGMAADKFYVSSKLTCPIKRGDGSYGLSSSDINVTVTGEDAGAVTVSANDLLNQWLAETNELMDDAVLCEYEVVVVRSNDGEISEALHPWYMINDHIEGKQRIERRVCIEPLK